MIEVFREEESPQGDWIEAELREMVLGYERVVTSPEEALHVLGAQHSLPAIKNGERIASGKGDLMIYLKELEALAHQWRAFQGDWCYVDDQGEVC
jgi:hypothetical protein